jgi:hypothetical protein
LSNLLDQIAEAPHEQVLEALVFLAQSLGVSLRPDLQAADTEPTATPSQETLLDIASIARIALSAAALSDQDSLIAAELALQGAGRKQFILGGAGEIAVLGTLGISLLHVIFSRGKISEETAVKIEVTDGGTVTTISKRIRYGISSPRLGGAIRQAIAGQDAHADDRQP